MPPHQTLPPQNSSISPRSSAAPLLPASEFSQENQSQADEIDPKTGKKRFFGLGGRESTANKMDAPAPALGGTMQNPMNSTKGFSDLKPAHPQPIPISPARTPYQNIASPSRLRSSSPRLHSPASSEIFERSVQEPIPMSNLQDEMTTEHIPTHVLTEDHIPPALEASAQAIASKHLGPDEVEIVTSSAHQPAADKVLEMSSSHADLTQLHSPAAHGRPSDASEFGLGLSSASTSQFPPAPAGIPEEDATANSTYGSLDPNDVRRLSFISFADVVQTEHQQQAASSSVLGDIAGSRDSLHIGSLPSVRERAESPPMRSPTSPVGSAGVTTPPPGINMSQSLAESPPARSGPSLGAGLGSPAMQHGELQIETMRQAVRKTASGDMSGARSAGLSPISSPDGSGARSRTNT